MKRKEELLKFGTMEASEEIVHLAEKETLHAEFAYVKASYRHEYYLSVKKEENLLAVGLFKTETLRLGGKKPFYSLFLEKQEETFITYDYLHQKWRYSMLDRLPDIKLRKIGMTERDQTVLKTFFGSKTGTVQDILEFQRSIRRKKLEERRRKETDPWDLEMKEVPELPKDWLTWVKRTAVTQHFIFYHYKRKVTEGYCSRCDATVAITNPRYNKEGRCPRCRKKIQYKAIGRVGWIYTDKEYAYLFQRCGNRVLLRKFGVYCAYEKGRYKTPRVHAFEEERFFFDDKLHITAYYYGLYKQETLRWIAYSCKNEEQEYHWFYPCNGAVYQRTMPSVNRTFMKWTGLYEMLRRQRFLDPLRYLEYQKRHPYLEKLVKAGLLQLAENLVVAMKELEMEDKRELRKALKVDRQGLKRLRKNQSIEYLGWLQLEKRQNKRTEDGLLQWFCKHGVKAKDVDFIEDRMSALQISNYLKRQKESMKQSYMQILTTWRDYLSMAEKLGMNIQDEVVYRTRKLEQRHDEAVQLLEKKNLEKEAEKMAQRYPKVKDIYREIKKKYEYLEDVTYAVLVPDSIYEVMEEGRKLHHCVGNEERYYDRINREESYILFLRKKRDLKKPYYTLEVEPDGTIRQKRKEYNRQGTEIRQLNQFLKTWQEAVQKRLTEYDCRKADISRRLWQEEQKELRERKVSIHGGGFAGELLADVLKRDRMEAVSVEVGKAA